MKLLLLFLALFFSTQSFAKKIELTESNHILLRGEVSDESVSKVIQEINTAKSKEVTLFIDSPGGSVIAGYKLIKTIENSGKVVTCIAANAASMAFSILQSCHKRLVMEDSIVMQHVMSYSLGGQEPNNYSMAQLMHKINVAMDKRQAKRIGISYEDFRDKVRDDWWLFGNDAVDANVADDSVEVSCTEALSKKTKKDVMSSEFTTVTITWSSCPINPAPIEVTQVMNMPGVTVQQAAKELKAVMNLVSTLAYFENRLKAKK